MQQCYQVLPGEFRHIQKTPNDMACPSNKLNVLLVTQCMYTCVCDAQVRKNNRKYHLWLFQSIGSSITKFLATFFSVFLLYT